MASTYGLDEYRLFIGGELVFDRKEQAQPIGIATRKLQAGQACAIRLEYVHCDHHARLGMGVRKVSELIEPEVKTLAAAADVAVVLAGFDPSNESEGSDRTFQLPDGQDELIDIVRGANQNTVVVQVYVGDGHAPVPRPVKELKGFAKVSLGPGQSKRMQISLDHRALSYFDETAQQRRAEPGDFDVLVGPRHNRLSCGVSSR